MQRRVAAGGRPERASSWNISFFDKERFSKLIIRLEDAMVRKP
jgi:hypothetical protein